ncbi:MAG: formylglycine-generating enzyme family protein [Candidatus Rokuibacteriota bacterium]
MNRVAIAVAWMVIVSASTLGSGAEQAVRADHGAEMVLVPASEFWMGSDDGNDDEKPRHGVDVDAYWIDKYEITNGLYQRFMEATHRAAPRFWSHRHLNDASQPVVGVSWHDADAFCRWVGKRLPTEAEWEKAARGDDGRTYPWGEQWDSSRANSKESQRDRPAPVGSYPRGVSPYGAYDMAGNVWEWVVDWYAKDYYERSPRRNPRGPKTGQWKVLRGGSWGYLPSLLRTTNRLSIMPDLRNTVIGFRCARGI